MRRDKAKYCFAPTQGESYARVGFCSAGLGQPERLSLISQLAEQDKQVNKNLLCKLFGVMKSSYYYGLKPSQLALKPSKPKP